MKRIEKILGEDASEKVYQEVQEIFRERLSDKAWQAYRNGAMVFDQDSTEEKRAYRERLTGKSSWVCQSIIVER